MNKAIAILPVSNWGGLAIYDIDTRKDKVIFAWIYGQEKIHLYTSNLRTTWKGAPYFISKKQRWYLRDFIRA